MEWIVREKLSAESRFNAGSKARQDIDTILTGRGARPVTVEVAPEDIQTEGKLHKVMRHLTASGRWTKALHQVSAGDRVYIQFPAVYFTPRLSAVLQKISAQGVCLVAVIHDLKSLREILDRSAGTSHNRMIQKEEEACLRAFRYIIVHNWHMAAWLAEHLGIAPERMIVLDIFDYLHHCEAQIRRRDDLSGDTPLSVVIAGNLAREKAGYVYRLPEGVNWRLYGVNYEEQPDSGAVYQGAFDPDELPGHLDGDFGLVWDGPDPDTCMGSFMGEYLQYNNPHKVSLYLSAQLPVIIWEKAAMADFIREHDCGITVASLQDVKDALQKISREDYGRMLQNARNVAAQLTSGFYTLQAVGQIDQ